MRQPPVWEPSDADITAYLLDDLDGARAEYVAAHIQVCSNCLERLGRLKMTLNRLEAMPQPDGLHSATPRTLKVRLESEAFKARSWLQRAQIGVVAVALITLALILGPTFVNAGSAGIHDIIGMQAELDDTPSRAQPDVDSRPQAAAEPSIMRMQPTIGVAELPFAPVIPDSLAGSNQLIDTFAYANGVFSARYAGADGLLLDLVQAPATTDSVRFSEGVDYWELQVDGVTVIATMDERYQELDQIFWVRGGMFFTLRAVRYTPDDFPTSEAIAIVEQLIELQDNPNPGD